MQYPNKFISTERSAKNLTQELGATSNSTLLKKRSSRLSKKLGGGSPDQDKEQNLEDLEFPPLPKRSCVLQKSEAVDQI